MRKYKHILFDLDHTLWDFDKNSAETLKELYDKYEFEKHNKFSHDMFVDKFMEVNTQLWHKYDRNQIDRMYLRKERFKLVLTGLGVEEQYVPAEIGEVYLRICPTKPHVVSYAFEILEYLKNKKYGMHVVTNGFEDVQDVKLISSDLKDYFDYIITSESAGHKKPNPDFFEYTLNLIGSPKNECIMIGDNPETDIKGALSIGLDVIFFNPKSMTHNYDVTYEITALEEIKGIL
ncbi:YjjG family noncanonical pyrimidine nucleotidase [Bacteroidota bacterium]